MTLDRFHVMIHGRKRFPFSLEFFCLFFERFLETRLTFDCRPPRSMIEVRMCMWCQMMPKRGLPEYLIRTSTHALTCWKMRMTTHLSCCHFCTKVLIGDNVPTSSSHWMSL